MKQMISSALEWVRPAGIVLLYFLAQYFGRTPREEFHILGPALVILMSGTVGLESLLLGSVGSAKVGYAPNRAYQVQSGLNNLSVACAAFIVLVLGWGTGAEAAVVTAMLLFFTFSAINHTRTAVLEHNFKPVNLMRPVMALLLLGVALPPLVSALAA